MVHPDKLRKTTTTELEMEIYTDIKSTEEIYNFRPNRGYSENPRSENANLLDSEDVQSIQSSFRIKYLNPVP